MLSFFFLKEKLCAFRSYFSLYPFLTHLHVFFFPHFFFTVLQAHHIKNRHSKTAKAIFALESSYKWALSGTPFENYVEEIYSLVSDFILRNFTVRSKLPSNLYACNPFGQIRFLQIPPYSFYLCKDCDCRVLEYRLVVPEDHS